MRSGILESGDGDGIVSPQGVARVIDSATRTKTGSGVAILDVAPRTVARVITLRVPVRTDASKNMVDVQRSLVVGR